MSDRSEREREAARLERERRRAEREGEAPPPPPPAAPEPSRGAEPAPPPAPRRAEPATPPAQEPEAGRRRRERRPRAAGSAAAPRADAGAARRAPPRPRAGRTRRSRRPARSPGAPGMPRHPLSVPPRRRRRSPARVAVLGGLIALLVAADRLLRLSRSSRRSRATAAAASSSRSPPARARVRSATCSPTRASSAPGCFFSLRATLGGDRDKLRAGRFVLHHDMSNGAALSALTTAPEGRARSRDVLIPEGPGRREVAPLVAKAGVEGDYLAASKRSAALNPRDYGAPRGTPSLEGFLFPATYRLKRRRAGADARDRSSCRRSRTTSPRVSMRRARAKNLTVYDVLIIASMIERETAVARERRLIAGVIYNRLKRGHPARHRRDDALRREQLDAAADGRPSCGRDSAFNTRLRKGLPPTPIGNPGLASIRAAAQPARTQRAVLRRQAVRATARTRSRAPTRSSSSDVAAYNAQARRARRQGPVDVPEVSAPADAASACSAGRSRTAARRRCTTPRCTRSG